MPKIAIVIVDPELAHAQEIERNVVANLTAVAPHVVDYRAQKMTAQRADVASKGVLVGGLSEVVIDAPIDTAKDRVIARVEAAVTKFTGAPKQAGDVHDIVDSTDCPDGLPNCRNCGDPAFAESCAKDGHCPDCGTKHGVAPDSVVAANGYALVELPDEIAG
jgi:hypothetical protein